MNRLGNIAKSGICMTAALSVACAAGWGARSESRQSKEHSQRGPAVVDLGTAWNYEILTQTGITTTGATRVTGSMGVSPIGSTAITGFGLVLSANGQYSTSSRVGGQVFAATYGAPTPSELTVAVGDMQHAYTDAAGRTVPNAIALPSELGGLTLPPGLYKTAASVGISRDITLTGSVNDVWIFQISQGLTQAAATKVKLAGGAVPSHVFWQVAGVVAIGSTAHMQGVVMGAKGITMDANATMVGRLYSGTDVTLIANQVAPTGLWIVLP